MAADKDTLTPEQSKTAQAIAAVMAKLSVDAEKVAESFRGQAKAMAELCEAMKCLESSQLGQNASQLSNILRDMTTTAGSASAALIDLGRNTQNLGGGFQNLGGQIARAGQQTRDLNKEGKNSSNIHKDLNKALENTNKTSILVTAAMKGLKIAYDALVESIKAVLAVSSSILGFFTSLISSAYEVAKSIASIPFKIFSSLIDMADKGGNEISELAQAINEMRKQFGSLTGPTNKAIKSTAEGMNSLRIAGTSTFQVFGNVAERMKMLTELYASAGPNLRSFADEITKSNGAQIALQKGLGLTAEGMDVLASISKNSGTSLSDTLVSVTKHADHMAKTFKLDAKVISREITKAASDFKNFGNVSIKEMGIAVTYAQKLGLSLDKITGTMDSFGTFDSAADNVSKLNEAFGTNIDAMEIMQAETPDKKLEILRRSMRQAGIQGEKLNHVQRKLIASATGLDDQAIISAMSTKNYGVSLKEIQKEGSKAEKKTLTQSEAMEKLADAMDRMLKAGQSVTGGQGLFGALMNGFERGLQLSPQFVEMMRAIKRSIMTIFTAGQQLGKAFVDLFPGISELFDGIKKLFDPAKISKLTNDVVAAFKEFFKDIGDPNSKNSFGKLMEKLQNTFFNFFDSNKEEGQSVLKSFKKILMTIVRMIGEAIPWVMQKMTEVIRSIAKFIKNPKEYIESMKGAGGAGDGFGAVFAEAFENISAAWPALRDALYELFEIAYKKFETDILPKLQGWLSSFGWKILKYLAMGFASMVGIRILMGALFELLKSVFFGAIEALFTGASGTGMISKVIRGLKSLLGPVLSGVLGKLLLVTFVADAAINISKSVEKFSDVLQKKGFDPASSKIAAGATGMINTLTFGLLPPDLQEKIATSIAKVATMVFKKVDEFFGPGFSKSIKQYMSGVIDIWSGLGDLLVALWNGDESKISKSLEKIGKGFIDMIIGSFKMAVNGILKIGPLILEYFFKLNEWIYNKLGSLFVSLKDVPVLGPVFEFIGNIYFKVAEYMGKIGDLFHNLREKMKAFDVSEFIDRMVTTIKNALEKIGNFFSELGERVWKVLDAITLPFKIAWALLVNLVIVLYDSVINPLVKAFKFLAKAAYDYVVKPIYEVMSFIVGVIYQTLIAPFIESIKLSFGLLYLIISTYLGKVWDFVKYIAGVIVDVFWSVIDKFREWGHLAYKLLTDPAKSAAERIADFIKLLVTTFYSIPAKLVEWGGKMIGVILTPFKDTWEWIKENLSFKKFVEIGENMLEGIKKGISKIKDKVAEPFEAAVTEVKNFFGIKSPSKLFEGMGESIVEGMDNGLEKLPEKMGKKAQDGAAAMAGAVPAASAGATAAAAGAMDSKSQIALEVVKSIAGFVQTIMGIIGGSKIDFSKAGAAEEFVKNFAQIVPSVNNLLDGVGDRVAPMVEKVMKLVSEVKVDETSTQKMKALGDIFKFIQELVTIFQNPFKDVNVNWEGVQGGPVAQMLKTVEQVDVFLHDLAYREGIGSVTSLNTHIVALSNAISISPESVKKIGDFFGTINSLLTVFKNPFKDTAMWEGSSWSASILKTVGEIDLILNNLAISNTMASKSGFGTVSSIVDHIKKLTESVTPDVEEKVKKMAPFAESIKGVAKFAETIAMQGMIPAVQAVDDMIAAAQRLDSALERGAKFDIDAKLKVFASKFGRNLGVLGKYVVEAKDVNIHVNFRIAIDSHELEKVMVTHGDSVIKQRINLLLDAIKDDKASAVVKSDAAQAKLTTGGTPSPMGKYS